MERGDGGDRRQGAHEAHDGRPQGPLSRNRTNINRSVPQVFLHTIVTYINPINRSWRRRPAWRPGCPGGPRSALHRRIDSTAPRGARGQTPTPARCGAPP